MRSPALPIAVIWIAISANFALAQTDACANPNAQRIGLLVKDKLPSVEAGSTSQLIAISMRLVAADIKFRDQLSRRLPSSACVVTSRDIFDDPKNYPQLKGSTIIEVSSATSLKNPNVFALVVIVSATEGIYTKDQFQMFTIPILIETDSDYAQAADTVMKRWQFFGEAWDRGQITK